MEGYHNGVQGICLTVVDGYSVLFPHGGSGMLIAQRFTMVPDFALPLRYSSLCCVGFVVLHISLPASPPQP